MIKTIIIIFLGVEDNGRMAGLTRDEMKASLKTLRDMAARLGATTRVLQTRLTNIKSSTTSNINNKSNNNGNKENECGCDEKRVAEVLIRKLRKDDREDQESVVDLRLAVTGCQDAGKSTLLGKINFSLVFYI